MAQLNITLNQEEILHLLENNTGEGFRKLLQDSLNAVLKAESAVQLGAEPYERSEERTDSRNGTRVRGLTTRIGRITLQVPRHRNQPFKSMVFENYSRSEAALMAGMAEMVVNGISTRKVQKVMETLCGTGYSKSTVSELCKDLEGAVKEFKERKLESSYPFVTVDATYFKVREDHRVTSKALFIAYATNKEGHNEIIGFDVYDSETKENWRSFLAGLQKRGLSEVLMITSDAHEGIKDAVAKRFPNVPWQRCQFHFSRNIADKAPKRYQTAIRDALREMFNCETLEQARTQKNEILTEYWEVAEDAMRCLDEGFESAMTVMTLPKHLRRYYRTSNHIERLNKELKRRSDVIGIFPNDGSLLRLMGSVLIERNELLQSGKAVFSSKTYEELMKSDTVKKLIEIAREQQQLLAA